MHWNLSDVKWIVQWRYNVTSSQREVLQYVIGKTATLRAREDHALRQIVRSQLMWLNVFLQKKYEKYTKSQINWTLLMGLCIKALRSSFSFIIFVFDECLFYWLRIPCKIHVWYIHVWFFLTYKIVFSTLKNFQISWRYGTFKGNSKW